MGDGIGYQNFFRMNFIHPVDIHLRQKFSFLANKAFDFRTLKYFAFVTVKNNAHAENGNRQISMAIKIHADFRFEVAKSLIAYTTKITAKHEKKNR